VENYDTKMINFESSKRTKSYGNFHVRIGSVTYAVRLESSMLTTCIRNCFSFFWRKIVNGWSLNIPADTGRASS
jgi:hypothetical protein